MQYIYIYISVCVCVWKIALIKSLYAVFKAVEFIPFAYIIWFGLQIFKYTEEYCDKTDIQIERKFIVIVIYTSIQMIKQMYYDVISMMKLFY